MADQDFTFNEGIDPSSTWGVHASVLLQLIREAKPNAYRGMLIYSATTPVVTGSYVWQKRCAWINTTDWHLYLYNNTLSSWVDVLAAISDGAINRTAMFADQVVSVEKMVGNGVDSAGLYLKCGLDDLTLEWAELISGISNGSLPLSKLVAVSANEAVGSIAGGTPQAVPFSTIVQTGLPGVNNNSIPIVKLVAGADRQVLAMFSDTPTWQNVNDLLPDNGIEQKKIQSQTTTLTATAGVVVVDASLGDNFILTLTANVTSFTVINLVDGKTIQIKILQGGAGSYTVTFSGIHWPASTAPVITATLAHYDIVSITSFSGVLAGARIADFNA